jgi:hypothetical protein
MGISQCKAAELTVLDSLCTAAGEQTPVPAYIDYSLLILPTEIKAVFLRRCHLIIISVDRGSVIKAAEFSPPSHPLAGRCNILRNVATNNWDLWPEW